MHFKEGVSCKETAWTVRQQCRLEVNRRSFCQFGLVNPEIYFGSKRTINFFFKSRRVAIIRWGCRDSRLPQNTHFTPTVKLLQRTTA